MKPNYLAMIQGGIGPDVWEKEISITACDFADAATQACNIANENSACVVSLDANDWQDSKHPVPWKVEAGTIVKDANGRTVFCACESGENRGGTFWGIRNALILCVGSVNAANVNK